MSKTNHLFANRSGFESYFLNIECYLEEHCPTLSSHVILYLERKPFNTNFRLLFDRRVVRRIESQFHAFNYFRNPYNGYKYLCGATPQGIFLMQWYDPLNKFMLLKVSPSGYLTNFIRLIMTGNFSNFIQKNKSGFFASKYRNTPDLTHLKMSTFLKVFFCKTFLSAL